MEILNEGWFGTVAGALIGVLTGIYFYKKSLRVPELRYSTNSIQALSLHGPGLAKLDIRYEGRQIPSLTVATVTIWNGGTAVLEGAALVTRDPLRIELSGFSGEILEATIVSDASPQCNLTVAPIGADRRVAEVRFDYLDVDNGAVVRLLHTSTNRAVSVTGTLKGVSINPINTSPLSWDTFFSSVIVAILVMALSGIGWLVFARFNSIPILEAKEIFRDVIVLIWVVFASIWSALGMFRLSKSRLAPTQIPLQLRSSSANL